MELFNRINSTIDRFEMYGADSALVLMVSGGADSIAMLRAFASKNLPDSGTCEVLHVNHQLRGEQADADEQFVCDLCNKLAIPYNIIRFDVEAHAKEHDLNVEDAGRIIRYQEANKLLDKLCRTHRHLPSKSRIVTAHTLDDRIENFFWRALWGAGTGALGSIPAVRDNVIRPLISVSRREIIEYLNECGQSWCEDATNQDTSRTRAAIRHSLIPSCEEIRPTFRRSLERTMDLAAGDNEILTRMEQAFARDFSSRSIDEENDLIEAVNFHVPMMRTLDKTMRARTIRSALFEVFPDVRRIDGYHIDALVDALDCDTFARDLGYDLRATLKCDTLRVGRISREG
jgi:tRNA(Ile)-lysidine synthase